MQRQLRPHAYGAVPLWGSTDAWREANETLSYLIQRHRRGLNRAIAYAEAIRCELVPVFTVLDTLCVRSCPWCPDPCCQVAKIWIDFKDLLFLHLTGGPVPPAPLLAELTDICRYLGPRGCLLDRISRPWICTWYLCPTQQRVIQRGREDAGMIERAFAAIKDGRKKMESEFIHVVSECRP